MIIGVGLQPKELGDLLRENLRVLIYNQSGISLAVE